MNEEQVEYVVIGGFAAVIHGSSLPTRDVDIVPLRSAENLDRLGRALLRMNAMIREKVETGLKILVGSLDDVIESKRGANRLKDQRDLPYLESLRDEAKRETLSQGSHIDALVGSDRIRAHPRVGFS